MEKAKSVKEEIQKSVKEAEKMGEDVKDEVTSLLNDLETIIENGNKLLRESKVNYTLYDLSKEAVEKMKSIDDLLPKKLYNVSNPAPLPTMEFIYEGDFNIFTSTKLTMDKVKEALKDENIHVIGVYGMGGVGKNSLVTEVGKQVEKEKFFDKVVVMAVVSQEPNFKQIQGEIADMLGLEFNEESVRGRQLLEKERCFLVILDDIWAKLELKKLGIPDAWDLFKRNAGNVVENDNLIKEVSKDLAKECGGLPIYS
ncbi:PREDICTED: probable disease resistance protein At4g27220 [Nelumbo nucifera]|uniref:Probable disease resistance protein At4g27220 n=1 Tax=Nelumbo nucifera TaxID=4432 RepID=A0A1U8Q4E8_NELNU|nr:PREDICTED: probable disease resistance protein At4g27220 [Nelumbo nucifera]